MYIPRVVALAAVLGVAGSASAFFDDFNRADANTLGANWSMISGNIGIRSNMAACLSSPALAYAGGVSQSIMDTYLTFDVFSNGTNLQYDALCMGMTADGSDGIFIKVQQQDGSGSFNTAGFYRGNNNGGWSGGLGFFNLTTSFQNGRLSIYMLDADTVRLGIDSNFDGVFDQTYDSPGVSAFSGGLGTNVGIGMYGDALGDNFNVVPEPVSLLAFGGLTLIAIRRRRR